MVNRVGFWSPEVQPIVDKPNYGPYKDAIVEYLANGIRCACYNGFASCRLCEFDVGCDDYTDRVWLWPSGFQHYILNHAIELPEAFIAHLVGRNFSYEGVKPVLVVESGTGGSARIERPPLRNYARYGGPGSEHVVHDDPNGPSFSFVSEGDFLVVWGLGGPTVALAVGGNIVRDGIRLRLEPPR